MHIQWRTYKNISGGFFNIRVVPLIVYVQCFLKIQIFNINNDFFTFVVIILKNLYSYPFWYIFRDMNLNIDFFFKLSARCSIIVTSILSIYNEWRSPYYKIMGYCFCCSLRNLFFFKLSFWNFWDVLYQSHVLHCSFIKFLRNRWIFLIIKQLITN